MENLKNKNIEKELEHKKIKKREKRMIKLNKMENELVDKLK